MVDLSKVSYAYILFELINTREFKKFNDTSNRRKNHTRFMLFHKRFIETDSTNLVSAMQSDSFDQAPGRVIYKEIHDLLGSSRVFLLYLVFLTNAHMCSLILQPVRLTGG
jgi:hypothetical protein